MNGTNYGHSHCEASSTPHTSLFSAQVSACVLFSIAHTAVRLSILRRETFLAYKIETCDGLVCHLVSSFVHTLPHPWQDISTKMDDSHSPKHVALHVYYDVVAICFFFAVSVHQYIDGHFTPLHWHKKSSNPQTMKRII